MFRVSEPNVPEIFFRITHNGGTGKHGHLDSTPGFDDGYLTARDPKAIPNNKSIDDHLSWSRKDGPWMSLCTWPKAERLLKFFKRRCAKDITINAFDSSAFTNVISAYEFAKQLGYSDDRASHKRRRKLANHDGEYLVFGGYGQDRYRLLAVVPLRPPNTWTADQRRVGLLNEIHGCTGVPDERLLEKLLQAFDYNASGRGTHS